MTKTKLTQARLEKLMPPPTGEYTVADTEVTGLMLRVRAGGTMTWCLRYRVDGRGGRVPRLKLGVFPGVGLQAARDAARLALADRAKGVDPQAKRKEAARRKEAQLGTAFERYAAYLECQGPAGARLILPMLRRELVTPLGAGTDLSKIDRAMIAKRSEAIAASGRSGTSREFRTRTSVFLNWAASQGLIAANPLAGMRAPRATRAQELEQHGRALKKTEIGAFWHAAAVTDEPFYVAYLRTLLLTGCRRTELAVARWTWIERDRFGRSMLVLPREITKNSRAHAVPLPGPVLAMLQILPRRADTDLIFPAGRGEDTPMSGWSKRWTRVSAEMERLGVEGRMTMHDCRRTARSWWTELGVAEPVAELMLNHRPKNRLVVIYDRSERMDERHQAAESWADFVFEIAENATAADDASTAAAA